MAYLLISESLPFRKLVIGNRQHCWREHFKKHKQQCNIKYRYLLVLIDGHCGYQQLILEHREFQKYTKGNYFGMEQTGQLTHLDN